MSIVEKIVGRKEEIIIPGFSKMTVIRPSRRGEMVTVEGLMDPIYDRQTEFGHAVVVFGDKRLFDDMKGKVPVRERWGCLPFPSMPSEVVCLPNDLAMNEMTRVANTPGVYEDLSLKIKFRKSLGEALGTIRESQLLDSGSQRVAVKRAGVVAAELLHGPDKALVYEAKRLPFDGTLGVGMDDPDRVLTADNLDGQDVEIDEVFVASGITVLGFMADIHSRGIRPESLTIVAPFTAQRGAEAILDLSSRIGLKTRILTNRIYYWLNDHWYVLVTPEEEIWQEIAGDDPNVEVQAGGDAGDLTEN